MAIRNLSHDTIWYTRQRTDSQISQQKQLINYECSLPAICFSQTWAWYQRHELDFKMLQKKEDAETHFHLLLDEEL